MDALLAINDGRKQSCGRGGVNKVIEGDKQRAWDPEAVHSELLAHVLVQALCECRAKGGDDAERVHEQEWIPLLLP